MDTEHIVTVALAFALVGMAVFFARGQKRALLAARADERLSAEDRQFFASQTRRRLFTCALMILVSALLIGWLFLEQELQAVHEQFPEIPKDHPIVRIVTFYWIFACLVLFVLLVFAGLDVGATAKFALRHQRQIQEERNAMLAAEVTRLRDKHLSNGHGNSNGIAGM